jgi:hypothetical protein
VHLLTTGSAVVVAREKADLLLVLPHGVVKVVDDVTTSAAVTPDERDLLDLWRDSCADDDRGSHDSLGASSNASHFARVGRASTGNPPPRWRHMSQTSCRRRRQETSSRSLPAPRLSSS